MSKEINSSKDPQAYILPHQCKSWNTIQPILQWMKGDPCTSNKDLFDRMNNLNAKIQISNLIHVNKTANKQDLWKDKLLSDLIPYIAGLALEMESLFEGQTIRILRRGVSEENRLTRRQISSILANMFFCTLQSQGNEDEAKLLPGTYNFDQIITHVPDQIRNALNIQKLRCWLNYFWIIRAYEDQWEEVKDKQLKQNSQANKTTNASNETQQNEEQKMNEQATIFPLAQESGLSSTQPPESNKLYSFWEQVVVFERLVLSRTEQVSSMFLSCQNNLSEVIVDNTRGIEEFSEFESVHVDFADKYLGGGVLRTGCVQEEIMFAVSPELIAAIPFTHRIYEHEAILISGTHRFCEFKGYAQTFCFNGQNPLRDTYPSPNSQQKTHTLAIDALPFKQNPEIQYSEENLIREISKAYVGFRLSDRIPSNIPIITGNWGCGIFNGDPQLKFVIQLIAASFLSRKLYYVPFSNPALKDINKVLLKFKKTPINQLYYLINEFSYQVLKSHKKQSLFEFLLDNKNKIPL